MDIAILIVRLIVGLGVAAHGAQKLFGWFGGHGLTGTGGFFTSMGFRPGVLFAAAAGLGEFVGGLLVALGLGGPIGPALVVVVMVVAAIVVHLPHGFFASNSGFELPVMYASLAVLFAFVGFGLYSLDAAIGAQSLTTGRNAATAIIVAVIAGIITTLVRRPPPRPTASA